MGAERPLAAFPAAHPVFPGHFPGAPCVPGALLLDAVVHALAADLRLPYERVVVSAVKFHRPVTPGETVLWRCVREAARFRFALLVTGALVASGVCSRADDGGTNGPRRIPQPAHGGQVLAPEEARLPHTGAMRLLTDPCRYDRERILCPVGNHRDPEHPLRAHQRLGAACAVEYAAQAMAAHASALHGQATPVRAGALVSVRQLTFAVERLDALAKPVRVLAACRARDRAAAWYEFALVSGDEPRVWGESLVALDRGGQDA